jgi:DNA-binding MarR family transcriptional regulator
LSKVLAKAGLQITWYDVLLVLNAAPDRRLTMTELGARAVVSRERVSRVVTELEAAGLVERQSHPDDKRSSYAVITADGRRRLRAAAPHYLDAIEQHYLRHLSDSEIQTLQGALSRVAANEENSAG